MQRADRLIFAVIAITLITATAAPIAPGNRIAFCRGEVSGKYGTKPVYVKTGKLRSTRDGFSVSGTVDKGTEGVKRFKCRFDTKGRFVDVMAMTPDRR